MTAPAAPQIFAVYDKTDRNRASPVPVALALNVEAADKEVLRLQEGLSHAKGLVYRELWSKPVLGDWPESTLPVSGPFRTPK